MKNYKKIIICFLSILIVLPFGMFSANAFNYREAVKESKGSVDFSDDKVTVGIDSTQRKSTEYNDYTHYNSPPSQNVNVRATQETTYNATLPAILIVDGTFRPDSTNDFAFNASVEGNLAGDVQILLNPDSGFTMSSFGKEDISATITQEKTKFTYEDGVRIGTPVVTSGIGKVNDMTAGLWYGSWNYSIRLLPMYNMECYEWENDDYTTGVVTGITDIGLEKLETYGIMMFPDAGSEENFEGVTSIKSTGPILFNKTNRKDNEIFFPNTLEEIANSTLATSPFYKADVEKVTFESPSKIKRIGDYAFACAKIKDPLVIPASVESLGKHSIAEINGYIANLSTVIDISFEMPSNLKTIEEYAFYYCNVTGTLVLPEGLTTIENNAFTNANYEKIVIPDSVTTIGSSAFTGRNLMPLELNIPKNIQEWDTAFAFSNIAAIQIPNNVTEIPDSAFQNCKLLENITIPDNITRIGNMAFMGCVRINSINIPESVTFIGGAAFRNTNISSLTIPDSVNEIGVGTYWGRLSPVDECKKLTTINIESLSFDLSRLELSKIEKLETVNIYGGSTIPAESFKDCKALKTVTLPADLTHIGTDAFRGSFLMTKINFTGTIEQWLSIEFDNRYADPTAISKNLYQNNVLVTSINVPSTVTSVGGWDEEFERSIAWEGLTSVVFEGPNTELREDSFFCCKKLSNIVLPSNLKIIPNYCFGGLDSLSNISIPETVEEIGESAFESSALRTIVIPDSVTKIGEAAFSRCSKLTSITLSKNITVIPKDAFSNCSVLSSIDIPDGVTDIGTYAFAWTKALTELYIPNSVQTMERYCLYGGVCKKITLDKEAGSIPTNNWGRSVPQIIWLR